MHTVKIMAAGLGLLILCLVIGRVLGGSSAGFARGALVFIPFWLVGAGVNMWVGVEASLRLTVKSG